MDSANGKNGEKDCILHHTVEMKQSHPMTEPTRKGREHFSAFSLFIIKCLKGIAVRLRGNKKVQNLSSMWYKKLPQQLATQGDFGLEPSYYTLLSTAIPDTGTCF